MSATARTNRPAMEARFESHRAELTGYCYRMLGSGFEAEDAVQETLLRAWRGMDRFEGRSTLRAWLYSIATNVCLNMLKGAQRRARPMELGPASSSDATLGPALAERTWVGPIPDRRVWPTDGDPAELAVARETIRLAFVAALQLLPPRQRAVLILREVLRWSAADVAELLETSVVSVKSALQRARATLATSGMAGSDRWGSTVALDSEHQALVDRYVDAVERWDIDALVALLHDDATLAMPPHALWLQGAGSIHRWFRNKRLERLRVLPTAANGSIGLGVYRIRRADGAYEPFQLQVVEASAGRITAIHAFLDPSLFVLFDLPARHQG